MQVIVITRASSGFGALAARRLADAGDTVYAGMRATTGRNSTQVDAVNQYAKEHHVPAGYRDGRGHRGIMCCGNSPDHCGAGSTRCRF